MVVVAIAVIGGKNKEPVLETETMSTMKMSTRNTQKESDRGHENYYSGAANVVSLVFFASPFVSSGGTLIGSSFSISRSASSSICTPFSLLFGPTPFLMIWLSSAANDRRHRYYASL